MVYGYTGYTPRYMYMINHTLQKSGGSVGFLQNH